MIYYPYAHRLFGRTLGTCPSVSGHAPAGDAVFCRQGRVLPGHQKGGRPTQAMQVKGVLQALDTITGGRCVRDAADLNSGKNRFVLTKSSGIFGKACTETPGLVYGNPDAPLKKIAVVMTLTESCIELAAATGIEATIAHHPVADGASCGGVTLRDYLSLYGIAVFELHEASHGLRPGIAYIHGHRVFRKDIAYRGIPGNVLLTGRVIEGIVTLGDIIDRINLFSGSDEEMAMLDHQILETAAGLGLNLLIIKGR
jgi:hypothetical protein